MVTATGAERRRHHRYGLAIPVQVQPGKGATPPISTITRDISATGIYFGFADGIEPGSEMNFELVLPPQMTHGKPMHIRCHGKIVRVELPDAEGKIGVAATIEKYDFIRAEE